MEDNGNVSWITEDFIVEALTYSDAEVQAYKYAEEYWSGTFRIQSVTQQKVTEAYGLREGEDGDIYKLKFTYESETDGRVSKIKKFSEFYYVIATGIVEAIHRLEDELIDVNYLGQEVEEAKKLKIVDYICDDEDGEEVDPMM